MPDVNPYEPPRTDQPLTRGRLAKRGLGVLTILFLIPLAVAVAFGASCGATMVFVNLMPQQEAYLVATIVGGFAVFLIPPILALAGMIWWAVRTYRTDLQQKRRMAHTEKWPGIKN